MAKVLNETEFEVIENEEEVVEAETEKEGFLPKAKTWIKKHGKKIAIGATVIALGTVAYALGKKKSNEEDSEDTDLDVDWNELEDHSSDSIDEDTTNEE